MKGKNRENTENTDRQLGGLAFLPLLVFLVLYIGLSGRAGFFEIAGPLFGLGGLGFWIWSSVARSAPGSYDPRHLPRDVFPE